MVLKQKPNQFTSGIFSPYGNWKLINTVQSEQIPRQRSHTHLSVTFLPLFIPQHPCLVCPVFWYWWHEQILSLLRWALLHRKRRECVRVHCPPKPEWFPFYSSCLYYMQAMAGKLTLSRTVTPCGVSGADILGLSSEQNLLVRGPSAFPQCWLTILEYLAFTSA